MLNQIDFFEKLLYPKRINNQRKQFIFEKNFKSIGLYLINYK